MFQFILSFLYKVATGQMNEVDDVREDEVIDKISMKHDKNGITQQNGTTHDHGIHDKNGSIQENGIPTKNGVKNGNGLRNGIANKVL